MVHLSICSYVCLSICPLVHLSIWPTVPLSLCPSVYLSICPSIHQSICLFTCPSALLSICISNPTIYPSLSVCLVYWPSVCASVCLSVWGITVKNFVILNSPFFDLSVTFSGLSLTTNQFHKTFFQFILWKTPPRVGSTALPAKIRLVWKSLKLTNTHLRTIVNYRP
jgi:hypothetical protein